MPGTANLRRPPSRHQTGGLESLLMFYLLGVGTLADLPGRTCRIEVLDLQRRALPRLSALLLLVGLILLVLALVVLFFVLVWCLGLGLRGLRLLGCLLLLGAGLLLLLLLLFLASAFGLLCL